MRAMKLALVVGCATLGMRAEGAPDSDRLAAAQRALIAWFECIECVDHELDRLLRYRDVIEGALITTLQNGPSRSKLAEIEEQLKRNYRPSSKQGITSEEHVAVFSENAVAGYRSRAAIALGRLRTPNALAALRRARDDSQMRPDVRAAARKALGP